MGTGFSDSGVPFSINFGKIRNIGEDFLHVGDEKIRLTSFQYVINETLSVGDSITFKYPFHHLETKTQALSSTSKSQQSRENTKTWWFLKAT
jgi:hypothetical protein